LNINPINGLKEKGPPEAGPKDIGREEEE